MEKMICFVVIILENIDLLGNSMLVFSCDGPWVEKYLARDVGEIDVVDCAEQGSDDADDAALRVHICSMTPFDAMTGT